MQIPTKRDEPSKRPEAASTQGAPASHAACAERKNVSVRVQVRAASGEPEELPEHGYGHGV